MIAELSCVQRIRVHMHVRIGEFLVTGQIQNASFNPIVQVVLTRRICKQV